jgi:hypothetical protein
LAGACDLTWEMVFAPESPVLGVPMLAPCRAHVCEPYPGKYEILERSPNQTCAPADGSENSGVWYQV